jgi:hemoglobin-like flavoprotein
VWSDDDVTPEQIALVDETLSAVRPDMASVATEFYERLFAADPSLRALFTSDPEHQRRTFARELDAIMSSIRDHDRFIAEATALGGRHRGYGVRDVHYEWAEAPLLGALASALGSRWTAAVEDAWRQAYHLTVEAMRAEGVTNDPVPFRP